jgi:hypothetical protein
MHTEHQSPIILPRAARGDRAVQLKSDSHFSGSMVMMSGGATAQTSDVESNTEMKIAVVLAMRSDVVDPESQVKFDWTDTETGKRRQHFFDFRVHKRNGDRIAVMVKNGKKRFCAKFLSEARDIVAQVTPRFADDVVLMTEKDICPIELHNATFLDGLKEVDPEADTEVRRAMRGRTGARQIQDIISEVGLRGRGFRAVGRLLRSGELVLRDCDRISPEAFVVRSAP